MGSKAAQSVITVEKCYLRVYFFLQMTKKWEPAPPPSQITTNFHFNLKNYRTNWQITKFPTRKVDNFHVWFSCTLQKSIHLNYTSALFQNNNLEHHRRKSQYAEISLVWKIKSHDYLLLDAAINLEIPRREFITNNAVVHIVNASEMHTRHTLPLWFHNHVMLSWQYGIYIVFHMQLVR